MSVAAVLVSPCSRRCATPQPAHPFHLSHLRTKPYTPRTNGKAERFIQTNLREWAYARSYESSEQRAQYPMPWPHHYDWNRPHASLGYNPPISRVPLTLTNVLGLHI